MNWNDIQENLNSRKVMPTKAPDLNTMKDALARIPLKYPKDLSRVIHVAGTNGKGSTCKTLEHLLISGGRRVGLFTSPHLVHVTERISIQGENISQELFSQAFLEVSKLLDGAHDLSHFEMMTAMAAWIFFHPESPVICDTFIFEIGMGGTWDATNAIPHGVSVITRLGLDHVPVLGTTLPEVAENKFGIIQNGQIVISQHLDNDVESVAQRVQTKTKTHWIYPPSYSMDVRYSKDTSIPITILKSSWGEAELSLIGPRACENTNLALTVFQALGFDPARFLMSLKNLRWPGRMERLNSLEDSTPIFFSGDHNVQGVQSLVGLLKDFTYNKIYFVVAIGKAKDADEMLEILMDIPNSRCVLTTAHFMGRAESDYGHWLKKVEGYFPNPKDALQWARHQGTAKDLIVITGSLYLYQDIL